MSPAAVAAFPPSLSEAPAAPEPLGTALSDPVRWAAVQARDPAADGAFICAVATSGVYCRPTCAARPKAENVTFYRTAEDAAAAGYRACKRCHPATAESLRVEDQSRTLLARALAHLTQVEPEELGGPSQWAHALGVPLETLRVLCRGHLGLSPRQAMAAERLARLRAALLAGESVTEAIYTAGYGSSGRAYEASGALGMAPHRVRARGQGETLGLITGPCSLGFMALATSAKGLCALMFGDTADEAAEAVRAHFARARFTQTADRSLLAAVTALVEDPSGAPVDPLILDLRGTAFQLQVWRTLQSIGPGQTVSYGEIARRIGRPKASRAVGAAVGANPVSVLVPCHRIVGSNGALTGYAWGLERKKALLAREGASLTLL